MSSISRIWLRAGLAGLVLCGVSVVGVGVGAGGSAAAQNPVFIVNRLGANVQRALSVASADPNGNLVFSPFSVGVALTMVSAGANGDTAAQMGDVLGITLADPHSAMSVLVNGVEQRGVGSLAVANSVWTQDGLSIEDGFSDTLSSQYGADLQTADFRGDPLGAVDDVNGWVAAATAGRIPVLLDESQVTAVTRLILVNAVHLDAEWASPFDPESTEPAEFTRGDGSLIETEGDVPDAARPLRRGGGHAGDRAPVHRRLRDGCGAPRR